MQHVGTYNLTVKKIDVFNGDVKELNKYLCGRFVHSIWYDREGGTLSAFVLSSEMKGDRV